MTQTYYIADNRGQRFKVIHYRKPEVNDQLGGNSGGNIYGNSEGSIYLGQDGNAYQVINGVSVKVSKDKLMIEGYKPYSLPDTITVDGITFHRDKDGKFFLVQNGQYVPISEVELRALDLEKFGGNLDTRLQQEGKKIQEQQAQQQNYLLYGGVLLGLVLLLKR